MYLDSSAIVKLVAQEAETRDLGIFLVAHRDHRRITSALARVEVMRACAGKPAAKRVLGLFGKVPVSNHVLDQAGLHPGANLRSLDAIHLASALALGDLKHTLFVAYDKRLRTAAGDTGFRVFSPGQS